MLKVLLWIVILAYVSQAVSVHYSPCNESATRVCSYGTNVTDKLLNFKKGGSFAIQTNTFDQNFYLCEEYNFNCGYLEDQTDFLTIANGVQLNLTTMELNQIVTSDSALVALITPYLGSQGERAQCLSNYFPLVLTDSQSSTVMNGYLARLSSNLSSIYNANKGSSSMVWSALSRNIITAVLEVAKINMNYNFITTNFFQNMLRNDWTAMSQELKQNYTSTRSLQYLRSAYLIDSANTDYNKQQLVSFLIDQSATVGSANYALINQFVTNYAIATKDDPTLISINYFDTTRDQAFPFSSSSTQASLIASIIGHSCRCTSGTNLGASMNSTIGSINAAGLPRGVPKIMVVIVGSSSSDNVYYSAQYARSQGITPIVIAVGSSYNSGQVLQIASTQSNLLYVSSYSLLPSFYKVFSSFLARQFTDVRVGESVTGNRVRVPSCPNYYRIARNTGSLYHKVTITHRTDPEVNKAVVYTSNFDPFPDSYSDCNCTEHYRTGIYTYEFYFAPVEPQNVPLKKQETIVQNPAYSYFTVGGNSLDFDIVVSTCPTTNCSQERLKAAAISSKNYNVNQKQSEGDGTNVENLTIFTAIGVGLATLGLGTYASINGLRKIAESMDEPTYDTGLAQRPETLNELGHKDAAQEGNLWEDNQWNDAAYHDDDKPSLSPNISLQQPSPRTKPQNQKTKRKTQKNKKNEKSHKSQNSSKSQESQKSGRSSKSQKSKHSEKSDNSDKSEKSQKSNKSEKSESQGRSSKEQNQRIKKDSSNILDSYKADALNQNW